MAEKQQQTTIINSWTTPESDDICQPQHVLHRWYVGLHMWTSFGRSMYYTDGMWGLHLLHTMVVLVFCQ